MVMVRTWIVVAAVVASACQDSHSKQAGTGAKDAAVVVKAIDAAAAGSGSGSATGSAAADSGSDAGSGADSDAAADDTAAAPDKPATAQIADLGAISAWHAVIDRAQYLDRRGQSAVVYGQIGAPILVPRHPLDYGPADGGIAPDAALEMVPSPYVWLVDDTEGNGTLGIRVELGDHLAKLGDRVALEGSWILDQDRHWIWRVESLHPLPPAPPSDVTDPQPPAPTHEIARGDLPSGARTISVARDNDAVYFMLVGPRPARDGDGWLVANELGDVPIARLVLPGERPSYGGQDMRTDDERWLLKKGQTYWVRIGKIRPAPSRDKPSGMTARTPPVRVN